MNHFDILKKTILKIKANKTTEISPEDQKLWNSMLKDIYDLMDYSESLFGERILPVPITVTDAEDLSGYSLCFEDMTYDAELDIIFKLRLWDPDKEEVIDLTPEQGSFAIDTHKPYFLHYLSPKRSNEFVEAITNTVKLLAIEWKDTCKPTAEAYLKRLMQDYIRQNMTI